MRLIATSTLAIMEFDGLNIPPYGILSHTWEEGEVSYQDMMNGSAWNKKGYTKIEMTCRCADAEGVRFVWVDTCCIDKSSSAELTEAINSMFKWYKDSVVCYVYLSDLAPSTDISTALKGCRWFTRGWTLQELIAPNNVNFLDQNWNFRGSKRDLLNEISSITGIAAMVLSHKTPLSSISVAAKMSWAAHRQTTKVEDISYCLLGIFDVNMPLVYGEGSKAFTRLQEEIIRTTWDLSVFAWKAVPGRDGRHSRRYSGILAECPNQFSDCGRLVKSKGSQLHADFAVTNLGIRIPTVLVASRVENFQGSRYILSLDCSTEDQTQSSLALYLRKCGADLFVRDQPSLLATLTPESHDRYRSRTIYILSKLPEIPDPTQNGLLSPEDNFIISNRVSAIQICLPPGLVVYDANPTSHRDSQDAVFFSTENTHDGWCSITFEGELDWRGRRAPVSCFFACFGWNSRPSYLISTLVDLSTCDAISLRRLLSELEREGNEFIPWALEELEHFGIPMQGSVTLAGGTVRMSHVAKKVLLPKICNSEMYQVDVFLGDV
ncbi:heterokaryon incompatibility protein-domain-containing protein [Thelonectria olida]|uniref:Heterokaryon incompatibility protein-domain-containing protein n=1 Tax=Thelonectria olida TaxID=1576542 RepID=A0A9P8VR37_9HYPO|nr:heterokaryon incompatibility protein-domain-containing protein [Thelonectria olida]